MRATTLILSLFVVLVGVGISCSAPREQSSVSNGDFYPRDSRRRRPQSSGGTNILQGTVISVLDGDTIDVLDDAKTTYRIRLKGIDAPENGQAFGNASRENLATLVARKNVTVEWQKLDRYRRIVGKVMLNGDDICLEQIRSGLAWHFKRFANEQSEADQTLYARAELEAQATKMGLWIEPSPIAPWNYRDR